MSVSALGQRFRPGDNPYHANLPYTDKQKALFGEASYKFNQFKLTAGGRWYDFHETRAISSRVASSRTHDTRLGDKTKSNGFSPRGIVSWEPNRNLSVNVQVAKGFRLGGVNDPLNIPLCTPADAALFGGLPATYKDETLWNYEAGVKYSKHGITFNAAAFYNEIKNLQVTLDAGSCSSRIVFNVTKAHAQGVEAEFAVHPLPGLDFSFAGSVLNSKFDSTTLPEPDWRPRPAFGRATACRPCRSTSSRRRPITSSRSAPPATGTSTAASSGSATATRSRATRKPPTRTWQPRSSSIRRPALRHQRRRTSVR